MIGSSCSVVASLCLVCASTPQPLPPPPPLPSFSSYAPLKEKSKYGYLWFYTPDGKGGATKAVEPYQPREGDILFFDDMSKWWTFLYAIASTAPPFHAGLVVKQPDGTPAVLESGPDDTLHVYVLEASQRLHSFEGVLQVRRCKVALTPEQSQQLTAFAKAQEGKRYAMWRLLLQGTPCKSRGTLRAKMFAKTYHDRDRWLCAEIVVTGAELMGLLDESQIKGTNTYPLDIVDDHMYNLSGTYEPAGYWSPLP
jgi:hypothetical protein